LRLYARGEQSIQKYKDELSINGDLSYLNLDWKPVPVLSKFVDIVVNGISDRSFDIKAYSQDPYGVEKRTKYMESVIRDMQTKDYNDFVQETFGVNMYENDPDSLPESKEELELHMQLSYKQSIEIAEETAINTILDENNYDLIKKRTYYDIATIGIGTVKNSYSNSEGITVDYVDPANIVYSHTESPYFEDLYYVGEIKTIPINELAKQFPYLTNEDLKNIQDQGGKQYNGTGNKIYTDDRRKDNNLVQVLYFNYKTYMNEFTKLSDCYSANKSIERDDHITHPQKAKTSVKSLDR